MLRMMMLRRARMRTIMQKVNSRVMIVRRQKMMMSRMNVEEEDDKDDIVAEDEVKVDDVEDH